MGDDHRWRAGMDALLGIDRNYYPGWEAEGSHCAPLGEAVCLDAGVGFRWTVKGPDGRPLFSGTSRTSSWTPKLHLGVVGMVKKGVGLGVRGEMGYSFVQQGADDRRGLFLGANLFMIGNVSERIGIQAAVGVVREPSMPRPDETEPAGRLAPETSLGLYLNF